MQASRPEAERGQHILVPAGDAGGLPAEEVNERTRAAPRDRRGPRAARRRRSRSGPAPGGWPDRLTTTRCRFPPCSPPRTRRPGWRRTGCRASRWAGAAATCLPAHSGRPRRPAGGGTSRRGQGPAVHPGGAEEERWPHAAALELSFVPQGRAGQRGDGHGRGPLGIPVKAAGDAGLVMALQEAHQPGLVAQVRAQVVPDGGRVLADDPVIEPLVVAEVEAVLLKLPLPIPVGFGDHHRLRVPGAQLAEHGQPELLGQLGPGRLPRSCRRCG